MADSEFFERSPEKFSTVAPVAEEYEAGYRSRVEGEAEFKTATRSWRSGWQDADRELAGSGFPLHVATQNSDTSEQWSLYGTGRQARACEMAFDVNRGEAWKRSWVEADIALGLAKRRRSS